MAPVAQPLNHFVPHRGARHRVAVVCVTLEIAGEAPGVIARPRALTGQQHVELAAIAEAAWAAARDCEPFTDGVASEWYRARMVELFTRRALERVARAAGEVN